MTIDDKEIAESTPSLVDATRVAYFTSHALTSAVVRLENLNPSYYSYADEFCEAIGGAVGSDGSRLYKQYFFKNTGIGNIDGFGNAGTFGIAQELIYDDYEPLFADEFWARLYSVMACSLLFGAEVSAMPYNAFTGIWHYAINNLDGHFNRIYGGTRPLAALYGTITSNDEEATVTTAPLSEAEFNDYIENLNFNAARQEIGGATPSERVQITNYSFYDVEGVFDAPVNLILTKDAESQYYQISGELIYDSITSLGGATTCEEVTKEYRDSEGTLLETKTFLTNLPCVNEGEYVGPVKGTKFYRVFNDGPYSSGIVDNHVSDYLELETNAMDSSYYEDQILKTLYDFSGVKNSLIGLNEASIFGGVIVDLLGFYPPNLIVEEELKYRPSAILTGVGGITGDNYGNFHIGNWDSRWRITGTDPKIHNMSPVNLPTTGYKFVALELSENIWGKTYDTLISNPPAKTLSRKLRRGLVLNPDLIKPTYEHEIEENVFVDRYHVGGPVLNPISSIPCLTFSQNFRSKTFGRFPDIKIGFAVLTAEEKTVEVEINPEEFVEYPTGYEYAAAVTKFDLFNINTSTGGYFDTWNNKTPPDYVDFTVKIDSAQLTGTGQDIGIIQKVLGVGSNMDSADAKILSSGYRYNAGHAYLDFKIVTGMAPNTGEAYLGDVLAFYKEYLLGATTGTNQYLYGYESAGGLAQPATPMYAQDENSEKIVYRYLDDRKFPFAGLDIPENDWAVPFPEPNNVEEIIGLGTQSRLLKTQRTENYHPRYQKGPFGYGRLSFQYPYGSSFKTGEWEAYDNYPVKLTFKVSVVEKAFYKKYADIVLRPLALPFAENTFYSRYSNEKISYEGSGPWKESKLAYSFTGNYVNNFWVPKYISGLESTCDVDTTYDYAEIFASGRNSNLIYGTPDDIEPDSYLNYSPLIKYGHTLDLSALSAEVGGATNPCDSNQNVVFIPERYNRFYTGVNKYYDAKVVNQQIERPFEYVTGYEFDVEAIYVLPGYLLKDRAFSDAPFEDVFINPSGLSIMSSLNTCCPEDDRFVAHDPIWFRVISDNTGVTGQSGIHPHKMYGDSWMAFNAAKYDLAKTEFDCDNDTFNDCSGYVRSAPETDDRVFIINMRSGGVDVHIRHGKYSIGGYTGDIFNFNGATQVDGSEKVLTIPGDGSQWVDQYFSKGYTYFNTYLHTETLLPVPDDTGLFTSMAKTNKFNELVYPTVEAYWQSKLDSGLVKDSKYTSMTGSGMMNLRRIGIKFSELKISEYDQLPYDSDLAFEVSGSCTISGRLSYHSQAEASIFSEGAWVTDSTVGDVIKNYVQQRDYVSDVYLRYNEPSGQTGGYSHFTVGKFPSRMIQRSNIAQISGTNDYAQINNVSPSAYNRYIVQGMSDFGHLNSDETLESLAPDDGFIYPHGPILFSAQRGQDAGDGTTVKKVSKKYYVQDLRQFYDGIFTDAAINSAYFAPSGDRGSVVEFSDPTGTYLLPVGSSYRDIVNGLVPSKSYVFNV